MKCGSSVCGSNMVEAAVWKIFPFNFLSSNNLFSLTSKAPHRDIKSVKFVLEPACDSCKVQTSDSVSEGIQGQYYNVLFSTIQYNILYNIVLYCNVWYIIIQHCTIMYIIVKYYTVLKLNHMIQHVVYMRYCNTYKVYSHIVH